MQITFDTGFERQLTLTHQDSENAKMIRAPQPETVRDYELLYRPPDAKEWTSLGKITGNYQPAVTSFIGLPGTIAVSIQTSMDAESN